VATTRSVPYASGGGRTAFTFNGGLLRATGLAPYGTSALTILPERRGFADGPRGRRVH
jgi:hypothetical protein